MGDGDAVGMVFSGTGRADPDEFGLLAEFFDGSCAAVAHPGTQTADQLVDVRTQFPLVRNTSFDPFGG